MKLHESIRSYTCPPDVPRREYWNESRPFVTIDPHLTFELDADQAWSFPRTQLIRFELAPRPNRDSPGPPTKEKNLVLQFHKAKLTVQTDHPQELLTAILAGRVSVLVRGPYQRTRDTDPFRVKQDLPPRDGKSANYISTGLITATTATNE